jgi:hypothetical protein
MRQAPAPGHRNAGARSSSVLAYLRTTAAFSTLLLAAACSPSTGSGSEASDAAANVEPPTGEASGNEAEPSDEPVVEVEPSDEPVVEVEPSDEPPVVEVEPSDEPVVEVEPSDEPPVVEVEPSDEPVVEVEPSDEPVVEVEPSDEPTDGARALPPGNAPFDYQIGGAYEPPDGVLVVSRDREAAIAPGLYNICYVNGFQTQPQDNDAWVEDYPELLVRDEQGNPILDEDWGEYLFDVSTATNRDALVELVTPWLAGCADAGFDAIEIDNLDSYTRSSGALSADDAVAYVAALSERAHELGLAIAQKNAAELLPRASEMGTDFAIAEECNRYEECADYEEVYGDLVFVIEYREEDFEAGCENHPGLSIVLRDRNVTSPGSNGYVYEGC